MNCHARCHSGHQTKRQLHSHIVDFHFHMQQNAHVVDPAVVKESCARAAATLAAEVDKTQRG